MSGAGTKPICSVRLAPALIEKLNVRAAQNHRSFSREVEFLLDQGIDSAMPTLRDQFAMQVLSILSGSGRPELGTISMVSGRETLAHYCYLVADAMLRKREKAAAEVPTC